MKKRKTQNKPWTDAELAGLFEIYPKLALELGPTRGALATAAELRARKLSPYLRTDAAVLRMANAYGVRAGETFDPTKPNPRALEALDLLRDYRGLPLSYEDFADELRLERKRAQVLLEPLVRSGEIESFVGPNGEHLFRAPADRSVAA